MIGLQKAVRKVGSGIHREKKGLGREFEVILTPPVSLRPTHRPTGEREPWGLSTRRGRELRRPQSGGWCLQGTLAGDGQGTGAPVPAGR